ncbi:MAG: PAS domain-containing protein [Fibrobacteria bacterium]|nr:PAS domain-containing protein [Fibrobacteria bacterium]
MKTQPKTILLVEDEQIIALYETQTLENFGYQVIIANSGKNAIDIIEKDESNEISLILMDIHLGEDMSGHKAAKEILKKRHLPIVFLTAYSDDEHVNTIKEITRYGYVLKTSGEFVLQSSIEMAYALFEAHNRVSHSEKLLNQAQNIAHIGHWCWDIKNEELSWSDEIFCIFGVDKDNFIVSAENFEKTIHPDDLKEFLTKRAELLKKELDTEIGHRIIRPDGEVRYVVERAKAVRDSEGQPAYVIGTVQDITERKQAESKISALLEEKETLLKEVHHRVKNNLNTLSSMISIHMHSLTNQETVSVLQDIKSRISSMTTLYDKLHHSENISEISSEAYISTLIVESIKIFPKTTNISINKTIDDFPIHVDVLIPFGLIINEIFTNVLKHAFKNREEGQINITLIQDTKQAKLTIKDNGVGIDKTHTSSDGFGMKLINILANQLHGCFEVLQDNGTTCIISFPL